MPENMSRTAKAQMATNQASNASRVPNGTSYDPASVNKAIESSNRSGSKIGGKEARLIHSLLKGRHDEVRNDARLDAAVSRAERMDVKRSDASAEESLASYYKMVEGDGRKPAAVYVLVNKNTKEMKTWSLSKSDVERKVGAQWDPENWEVQRR